MGRDADKARLPGIARGLCGPQRAIGGQDAIQFFHGLDVVHKQDINVVGLQPVQATGKERRRLIPSTQVAFGSQDAFISPLGHDLAHFALRFAFAILGGRLDIATARIQVAVDDCPGLLKAEFHQVKATQTQDRDLKAGAAQRACLHFVLTPLR